MGNSSTAQHPAEKATVSKPKAHHHHLERSLGPWQAASLAVGTIIGTGIFLKTATMTQILGSFTAVIAAWVIAGLLSYAGALSYAELAARVPKSGGEYAILREAYGPLVGFLFGWMRFCIGSPGSIAAYGVGAATFLNGVVPLAEIVPGGIPTTAVGFIIMFSALNCLAVSFGGGVQTFLTGLKVTLIIGLVTGIAVFGVSQPSIASQSDLFNSQNAAQWPTMSAFGLALIAALWAYDGWNNLTMVGGEIHEPHRNIPIALGLGVLGVIALYVSVNWSYFSVLSVETIQQSNSTAHPGALPVATKAAETFLGAWGIPVLSVAFVISAIGAMNGSILTGARVPFAMAHDGLFWSQLAKVHATAKVPVSAVIAQGVLASIFALSGTFDQLTSYVVVAAWTFYALTTSSIFIIRKRHRHESAQQLAEGNGSTTAVKDKKPPHFVLPGGAIIPILFICSALLLVINSIWTDPQAGLYGLLLLTAGLPVYWYFSKRIEA
jgi:APA family basic amino acid/polyamine antiporter